MIKIIHISIFIFFIAQSIFGQVPSPGAPQSQPIVIMNGYAHIGNGEVIENALITFREGKIENVVDARKVRMDLSDYKKIDASGKHVYPGMILIGNEIGLREIDAIRATRDEKEVGDIKPHVRSAIAYNTDSEIIPTLRFMGIQIAQSVPQGGRIPGTSSIMQLDAWNWEDAVYKENDAVHLNWPSQTRGPKKGEHGRQDSESFVKQKDEVVQLIADTRSYMNSSKSPINLKLEAMVGVVSGEKNLFVRVDRAEDIIDAIQTLTKLEIPKVILIGMRDVLVVKDLVKESGYHVVLDNVHRTPWRVDEVVDEPYRLPALVHESGIMSCLSYLTAYEFSSARNLPFLAGTAAAYGLSKEEALAMVTLNAAKVLGIEDRTGSLESGKDANIVISEGDILDMRTNIILHSFIQGRELDLEGRQQRLYRKYGAKYE
ncbi:MAG: amidohydrolase family protein [Cyclobacteriaceae bacterium]